MSTRNRGRMTRGAIAVACLGVALGFTAWIQAKAAPVAKPTAALPVDLFDAIQHGDVNAQMIVKNSREGQLILKNLTNRPLNLQMPAAFAGAPILAQGAPALGGVGNRGTSSSRNNNQNQNVGGGIGGGGLGGGGGGLFNIPPEKVGKAKFECVCLDHGKPDPNPNVRYELKQLEDVTTEPGIREVVTAMANKATSQRVAQAAAWSINNHMTWEQLAAKKINRLGRPDEPFFSIAEIRAAASLSRQAQSAAQARQTEKSLASASEERASGVKTSAEPSSDRPAASAKNSE